VYDPAAGGCTAAKPQAGALTSLITHYGWATLANSSREENTRALSKLITSQALAKAAANNDRRQKKTPATPSREENTRVLSKLITSQALVKAAANNDRRRNRNRQNQVFAAAEARQNEASRQLLELHGALAAVAQERDEYRRQLDATQAKVRLLEQAVLSNTGTRAGNAPQAARSPVPSRAVTRNTPVWTRSRTAAARNNDNTRSVGSVGSVGSAGSASSASSVNSDSPWVTSYQRTFRNPAKRKARKKK